MPFAAIYVPDFPVEAILRAAPELRGTAVAVVGGTPPMVTVIAVNEKAAQAGIEPGMTKLQAEERLASGGILRPRSAEREAGAHAVLLDCACGFSPRVEDTALDTVLLDLAGLERIFGPPARIAREAARRCSELGMEVNVAVASNPDAAILAARGFPGVTVIPAGQEAERLGSLPVDVLVQSTVDSPRSMGPESRQSANDQRQFLEILDTLDRWGVRSVRALAALPEVAITERLGQEGLRLQQLARGMAWRPLVPIEPPLVFEEAVELEYPLGELEPLSFLLNRMLEQLCARLAARALAANELKLKLDLEMNVEDRVIGPSGDRAIETAAEPITRSPDHQITRCVRLPVPMLDVKVFLKLLQLDLQDHPPGAPVLKLCLSAQPAEPRRAQSGLFLPSAPEAERLEITLAKIAHVVGKQLPAAPSTALGAGSRQSAKNRCDHRPSTIDHRPVERVGSPEILDTHRPDAFCVKKFSPPGIPPSMIGHQPSTTVTALRVFRPPLAAGVTVREGRPARLACAERPELAAEVTWCAGPWRSSGEWWSEQAWWREEWDVALGEALYRIYRDPTGWFVEGSYD